MLVELARKNNTAYVFTANGADWTEQASLVATDAAGAYNFGFAVALDGTTALVGAYTDWVNAQFSGSAYTFEGSGASWLQTRKFSAGDGAYNDQYGISVALDGGRAIIGAYQDDTVGGADAGSAYIYSEGVYEVAEDEQLTVAAPGILANDTDPEGGSLEATAVVGPQHGILGLNADGSFTYDSVADYSGPDSFTKTASDGLLDSNVATVSIVVTPVNDAPVAVADSYSVAEDGTLTRTAPGVLANDVDADGDSLEATTVAGPLHGTLDLNVDGSFTYEPAEEYSGPDSFTYQAYDGGTYSNTVTVTITVTSVNDAPVAADDAKTTAEDTKLTVAAPGVLANDTDAEGDLSRRVVTGPAHGTLALSANGSYTYTPDADWIGVDTFAYRAYDGTAYSNTATVTITVTSVDDAVVYVPIAGTNRYATAVEASKAAIRPGPARSSSPRARTGPTLSAGRHWRAWPKVRCCSPSPRRSRSRGQRRDHAPGCDGCLHPRRYGSGVWGGADELNAVLSGTVTRLAGPTATARRWPMRSSSCRVRGTRAASRHPGQLPRCARCLSALGSVGACRSCSPRPSARRRFPPRSTRCDPRRYRRRDRCDRSSLLDRPSALATWTASEAPTATTPRHSWLTMALRMVCTGTVWASRQGSRFPMRSPVGRCSAPWTASCSSLRPPRWCPQAEQRLHSNKDWIGTVHFIGGTAAVSQDVRDRVAQGAGVVRGARLACASAPTSSEHGEWYGLPE